MSRYASDASAYSLDRVNKELPEDLDLEHFKVVFVGDGGAGKTNLLNRFVFGRFDPAERRTRGWDKIPHRYGVAGRLVSLHFWDTAGQERTESVVALYYRHAFVCIAVYDTTSRASFDHLAWWIDGFLREQGDATPAAALSPPNLLVVGTKSDLVHLRQVDRAEGEALAARYGALFAETNAVRGAQADEFHVALGAAVIRAHDYINGLRKKPPAETTLAETLVMEHALPQNRLPWEPGGDNTRTIRLQDPVPVLGGGGSSRKAGDDDEACLC